MLAVVEETPILNDYPALVVVVSVEGAGVVICLVVDFL